MKRAAAYLPIAIKVILSYLFIAFWASSLFAVDIEISKFDSVSTLDSLNIVVFLDPSPVTKPISLNLRSMEGSGNAMFLPGNSARTNILQSSILTLRGTKVSCVESNMVLEVFFEDKMVASNVFTVVDKAVDCEPALPRVNVDSDVMITRSHAILLAFEAINHQFSIQRGAPITIELRDRNYVVTFGYNPPSFEEAPGWRGPDFSARVTVDAYTGVVRPAFEVGS